MKHPGILLAVAVCIAVLGVGVAHWVTGDPSEVGSLTRAEATVGVSTLPTRQEPAATATEPPRAVPAPAEAEPRGSIEDSAIAASAGLEVRAVRAGDKEPVVGATLSVAHAPEGPGGASELARWIATGQLEERIAASAVHGVTDTVGSARLPAPSRTTVVVATAPGAWGYRIVGPSAPSPIEILLHDDDDLEVEVVDPAGAPVARATVSLRFGGRIDAVTGVTGEAGLVVLRHAGHRLRSLTSSPANSWKIVLGAVLEQPVEHELDLENWPTQTVRMVLPETGALDVEVLDVDGLPYHAPVRVGLQVLARDAKPAEPGKGSPGRGLPLPEQDGPLVRFPHVELWRTFEASVSRQGTHVTHRARGEGPGAAGQSAKLVVRMGSGVPVVGGRLLDHEGRAVGDVALRAQLQSFRDNRARDYESRSHTDADGRFEIDLEPDDFRRGEAELTLRALDAMSREYATVTHLLPNEVTDGFNDLGDLVLEPSPLLVAGTVLDDDGAPVAGADVRVEVQRTRSGLPMEEPQWHTLRFTNVQSDAQGRFELRTREKSPELRVSAEKDDLRADAVVVQSGATQVELRLYGTGTIAGTLLLDPAIAPSSLMVLALALSGEDGQSFGSAPNASGAFEVTRLKPGAYTVRFMTRQSAVLHSVPGITVVAGSVTRDGLDPLDLRGLLRGIVLEIVDENDRPVEQGWVDWKSSSEQRSGQFKAGRFVMLASEGSYDVSIRASGFRREQFQGVDSDRRFVLRRGCEVRLVLKPGLPLPEPPLVLTASLIAIGVPSAYVSGPNLGFDDARELTLVAPSVGRHRISLGVMRESPGSLRTSYLHKSSSTVVEVLDQPGVQTFEVSFDVAEYEEVLGRLADSDR